MHEKLTGRNRCSNIFSRREEIENLQNKIQTQNFKQTFKGSVELSFSFFF